MADLKNYTLAYVCGERPFITYDGFAEFDTLEEAIGAAKEMRPDTYKDTLVILIRTSDDNLRSFSWDREGKPPLKLYCVVSREALTKMNGNRGKLVAQGGHAWLHSFFDSQKRFPTYADEYIHSDSAIKITLVVDTDDELVALRDAYRDVCGVSLVIDRGLTVFKGQTTTCLGIGPLPDELKGPDLAGLKTLL